MHGWSAPCLGSSPPAPQTGQSHLLSSPRAARALTCRPAHRGRPRRCRGGPLSCQTCRGLFRATVVRVGLLVAKVTLASWGWRFTPGGGSKDGADPRQNCPHPRATICTPTRARLRPVHPLVPGTGFPSLPQAISGACLRPGESPCLPLPSPSHPEQKPGNPAGTAALSLPSTDIWSPRTPRPLPLISLVWSPPSSPGP